MKTILEKNPKLNYFTMTELNTDDPEAAYYAYQPLVEEILFKFGVVDIDETLKFNEEIEFEIDDFLSLLPLLDKYYQKNADFLNGQSLNPALTMLTTDLKFMEKHFSHFKEYLTIIPLKAVYYNEEGYMYNIDIQESLENY